VKTEKEIRERIKFWDNMIKDWNDNNPDLPSRFKTPLLPMAAKVFAYKWVLDEGEDI
jgi:hypothetical protein